MTDLFKLILGILASRFKARATLEAENLVLRQQVSLVNTENLNDLPGPIVPPAREGHRRTFSEVDKRRIVEETGRPGASLSEVARRYGIAARVLFRWKQDLTQVAPLFVAVEIADATSPTEENAS